MQYLFLLALTWLAPKHDLQLQLEKGETYHQTYNSRVDIVQTINGVDQKMSTGIVGSIAYKVIEEGSNDYLLDATYTSLSMKMQTPMANMEFSSEKEGEDVDILSKALQGMTSRSFQVRMKKNGTIKEIINLDNVFEGMTSSIDGFESLPQMQRDQIMGQLKKAYGEEAFKGNIEMLMAIYPDDKVSLNDSWKNSVALEAGMSGTMENTFTLAETNDTYYVIEGVSSIKTADQEAYVQVNGMPTKYLLTGEMKATFKINPKSHWIMEADILQNMSGNVEIKDNPQLQGGMTIPIEMEVTTKVSQ